MRSVSISERPKAGSISHRGARKSSGGQGLDRPAIHPRKTGDFRAFLHEDLRVDTDRLRKLDLALVDNITRMYGSRKTRLLRDYLSQSLGERS